jgi:adenosine deaminase
MRVETLLELAQAKGFVPQSTSVESFRQKVVIQKPMKDLTAVLAEFVLVQKVLDRPEILRRVSREVVEDCYREGTRKVELRFSPSFVAEHSKLSWKDVLLSFEQGVQDACAKIPDIRVGLLCIASRDYGTEAAEETVEFYLQNLSRFVGIDLAGNEVGFPNRLFEKSFKKAAAKGAKITIHAGEAAGPENIWEAIDLLHARRIGHGVTSVKDPALMKALREREICLEMCPTSNWLTQAVPSFEKHPLPVVLRAGIPVGINTDDPTLFGVGMDDEIRICKKKLGMTDAEIALCHENASKASFL